MNKQRKRKLTKNQWRILEECEYEIFVDTDYKDVSMLWNAGLISVKSIYFREIAIITELGKTYLTDRQETLNRSKVLKNEWK
ncbi:hypothetical protein KAS31_01285 [Candidatus Parcubacteria bacterium]|nr:hypothetical protein [Candidatus Parcubacteria bacterium]